MVETSKTKQRKRASRAGTSAAKAATPLLAVKGLNKRFGDVVANDNVTIDIAEGEIHAILGENGAGKSTLMKMIYGVLAPDAGTMEWRGDVIAPAGTRITLHTVFNKVVTKAAVHFGDGTTLDLAANGTAASGSTSATPA